MREKLINTYKMSTLQPLILFYLPGKLFIIFLLLEILEGSLCHNKTGKNQGRILLQHKKWSRLILVSLKKKLCEN